jgi:hypothetical protein
MTNRFQCAIDTRQSSSVSLPTRIRVARCPLYGRYKRYCRYERYGRSRSALGEVAPEGVGKIVALMSSSDCFTEPHEPRTYVVGTEQPGELSGVERVIPSPDFEARTTTSVHGHVVNYLHCQDDEFRHLNPITVANLLRPFWIKPTTYKSARRTPAKGYVRDAIADDSFTRYCR